MAPRIIFASTPANPLLQVLSLIGGAIVLIGAVLMGAVILAVVIGIALVLGLVLWVRIWWLRRKFLRAGGARPPDAAGRPGPPTDGGVEITEVEYHVVRESRRDDT
jgi:predicted lipid-binding transport protein (Tim44 family)